MRAEKGGKGGNDSEQRANKPHKQGPGLVCVVGPCLSGQGFTTVTEMDNYLAKSSTRASLSKIVGNLPN
eukprot:scaffold89850_cov17-Tisochrysis_lutea.AAC.2